MNEIQLGELLLSLSLVFALTYVFGYFLSKFRIPSVLAALFVGVVLSNAPFFAFIHSLASFEATFSFLADLGVLFLLFYIGLQIELDEMKKSTSNIMWLTVLNTFIPFVFGVVAMSLYGYGWAIFWVGFNADMEGFLKEPLLAIIIFLAGTMGKALGVFLMVPMKRINIKEAVIIGTGLNARLTTEIIVAQLLYSSSIIDLKLFTALI